MRAIGAAVAAMFAVAYPAAAQQTTGLYVAGGAGANLRDSVNISGAQFMSSLMGSTALRPGTARIYNDVGWVGVGSVGYGWRQTSLPFISGFRAELEGNFRSDGTRSVREFGRILGQHSGATRSYGAIANGFIDFAVPPLRGIQLTPYLGLGIGMGVIDYANVSGSLAANNTLTRIDGRTPPRLAYNLIGGTAVDLASVRPGLSLTLEVRQHTVLNGPVNTYVRNPGVSSIGTNATLVRVTQPNGGHSLSGLIGLRYAFHSTAAPTAPVVTPAQPAVPAGIAPVSVARTYLIFFDWNSADLSARARDIIVDAAANARRGGISRLEVAGHTDTSGDPRNNLRLSRQRAENVSARLVEAGIPARNITTLAAGESQPRLPTGDNVREDQNRRVEILLK